MRIADFQPEKKRKYDMDKPEDLLVAIRYAYAQGVIARRNGWESLTGQTLMDWFKSDCAGVEYRRGHVRSVKQAFYAGWQCIDMAKKNGVE
jgi:hypothetical protein